MLLRTFTLLVLSAALSSCSYDYNLLAVARGGRLAFVVNGSSDKQPSCLRQIEVSAEGGVKARPEGAGEVSLVGTGTFWFESVAHDDACANRFPLSYGSRLNGLHLEDRGTVKAKPLRREVVYNVSTTTGATGYGSGRFIIQADGRIQNLDWRAGPLSATNLLENAD